MVSFTDHYNAISIDRFPSTTKIEKYSWYIHDTFYVSPSSSQPQRLFFFFITNAKIKTTTLQTVTGRDTPNLVLKRILRYFLKIQPLKKILQF